MARRILSLAAAMVLAPLALTPVAPAQNVTQQDLLKPLKDSWFSHSGDYTARRYSALTAVNRLTVKNLTPAWTAKMTQGENLPPLTGYSRMRPSQITGGESTIGFNSSGGSIKATMLEVDGILYATMPDNVWAVDARSGETLWHYYWKARGGTHIASRGVGLWHGYLFFETPDNYLVSLDAKTGKERWHREIAKVEGGYFSTPAPMIVKDHVLAGTGNDIDAPAFLKSYDPETGDLQWTFYVTPQKEGDPGLDTWKSLDAARHGGGNIWMPGAYDPETNLYITGTGNPTPSWQTGLRGDGDNLYTCSLVALDVDTGKLKWYFSTSPHDTHDYDSSQVPVLVDGIFNGRPRKMALTASRNGYFFVVDRITGEHLLTSKYGETTNWAEGLTPHGGPKTNPAKDASIGGTLISPNSGGTVNWQPPAYSPQTGLLYQYESNSFSMVYLTDPDPRGAMGLGGKDELSIGTTNSYIIGIDYKTGKPRWRHKLYTQGFGGGGLLATAGGLVFSGDGSGNLVALDAATGKALWGARIGNVSNPPQTYMLDGHQYVLAASGDTLYSFLLY
ncbi:acido-empty-quinoprotein group A [Terriglobus roseus]|uniref:Alcohol dehydrogenase (Cytochrome c) n=1 Tax=Terriglobus roseus TaxID=392734 RepID=A0A1H4JQZ0_9BACT|nr:acido-empty-quinoprotein group A [Terriglobus roseus]SEB48365.1 alcohol dehydrogenase (cytochrome c) [Terriglobus roseus]